MKFDTRKDTMNGWSTLVSPTPRLIIPDDMGIQCPNNSASEHTVHNHFSPFTFGKATNPSIEKKCNGLQIFPNGKSQF